LYLLPAVAALFVGIHLLVEGYRWQIVPAYVIAAIMVVGMVRGILQKANPQREAPSRRRRIAAIIGVVLQEAFLFTDTVMNNLKYAREGATEEECIEAAKQANAHDFIMHLPQGYDTMLTERGANLSQGQRQMITIARAMVADPKLMILDEATSNVDTRTEKLIQDGLRKLMQGKTSFAIAHRLSTIRDSAKIMVLNGGGIVEYAPHAELMAAKGFYHALYMSQFKGKAPGSAHSSDIDFIST
jgi:ATP-binding cassette subfamily B protein